MFLDYLKAKVKQNRLLQENAEHAIVLDDKDKYTVASQIALNLKGEWDAIEGYQKLIPFFKLHDDEDAVKEIEEIISDELNHSEILKKLMKKYDGNIPTSKD